MSTYCISDIHGQLEAFSELLKSIKFKKSDKLYLLGDYIDGGPQPIPLINRIMEMQARGFDVEALMGNHDFEFLRVIEGMLEELGIKSYTLELGRKIYNVQEILAEHTEENIVELVKIHDWIRKLKFSVRDCKVGARVFYLAHAYPEDSNNENALRKFGNDRKQMAIWYRMQIDEYPFNEIHDNRVFIYGHTPTCFLKQTDGKMRILKLLETNKIAIDCGGKAYGRDPTCQLAALRLDDLTEFYV